MKSLVQHLQEKLMNISERNVQERLVINRNTKVDDEVIDFGLKVKWAKCNVGAKKETDRGLYFSWANTDGHYDDGYKFDKENYKKTNGFKLKKSFKSGDKEYDAATVNMGSEWRMPTANEFKELYNNTEHEWTEIDGVKGMKFISKENSNKYVFFPAVGYYSGTTLRSDDVCGLYWSVDINPSDTSYTYYMYFNRSYVSPTYISYRTHGFPVRPVQD